MAGTLSFVTSDSVDVTAPVEELRRYSKVIDDMIELSACTEDDALISTTKAIKLERVSSVGLDYILQWVTLKKESGLAKGIFPFGELSFGGVSEMLQAADFLGVEEAVNEILDSMTQTIESHDLKGLREYFGVSCDYTPAEEAFVGKMFDFVCKK